MSLTSIIRPVFTSRRRQLDLYTTKAQEIQLAVLRKLLTKAADTEWGKNHGYSSTLPYEKFALQTPINTYEELKGDIDRMRHGEKNILWPGQVKWYAKSSGTTNDKSKFLPVSKDALHDTHYRGGTDTVVWYLQNYPKSHVLDGKALLLGGSHSPNYNLKNTLVGDLSAILLENVSPLVQYMRVTSKETALLSDFMIKRDRIAHEAINKNVTSLSGVPSWMLSVLNRVLEISGKEHINDIWPNLEVFFHGGVSFSPYREQYQKIITDPGMHYMETYNASEGFFGLQDNPADPAMSLMIDYGIFYEFIPMDELFQENPTALPLWEVETGRNYAMVISTSSGMWRYLIGDTIRFTSKAPYKFVITGRTKFFINAFGEELIVDNAEKGLAEACAQTGAQVLEYTAAPVFMDQNGKCRHQWVVEFSKEPSDLQEFARILDQSLQRINSDYEAKRYKDITLQPLELITGKAGVFNQWLAMKGKLGGQHKVPRLSNNREVIEQILALNV